MYCNLLTPFKDDELISTKEVFPNLVASSDRLCVLVDGGDRQKYETWLQYVMQPSIGLGLYPLLVINENSRSLPDTGLFFSKNGISRIDQRSGNWGFVYLPSYTEQKRLKAVYPLFI